MRDNVHQTPLSAPGLPPNVRILPRTLLSAFIFSLLCIFAPVAEATVIISCYDLGGGVAELRYDASSEPQLVRAFALDITVDTTATIEDIFDTNPHYWVYPGSTIIVDGNIIDDGTPVAPPGSPDALPGLGTYGITIEMGSLYSEPEDPPLPADTLFKLFVDFQGLAEVDLDISLNLTRGGVVLEDTSSADVDLYGCTLVPEPATLTLLTLGSLTLFRKRTTPDHHRHWRCLPTHRLRRPLHIPTD